MSKASTDKEVTSLLMAFEGHPDAKDLRRRLGEVLKAQPGSGELLDLKIIDPRALWHRPKLMSKRSKTWVGVYLIGVGLALLSVMPWVWSFASRVVDGKQINASFLGLRFTPTAEFSLILVVLLTAALGSVAVLGKTFSARAGHETLEQGYLWWYLTRPITAAGLGLAFYMAFVAGFFSATTATDRPALVIAATIGGLAGLFTDQVLKKMSNVLGLLPTSKPASELDDEGNDIPPGGGPEGPAKAATVAAATVADTAATDTAVTDTVVKDGVTVVCRIEIQKP